MNIMYYNMKKNKKSLIDKVEKLLLTKYDIKGDFVSVDDLWDMIDELAYSYEQEIEENKKLKSELEY